jgi:multiple sugar transport system permease protein
MAFARRRSGIPAWVVAVYILLSLGVVVMMTPFAWMISTSLKLDEEIFSIPIRWIPSQFDFENYREAWERINMGRLLRNTLFVCAVDVASQIVLGAMAGYAFARLRFPGRQVLFYALLITMMVPETVLLVPMFLFARAFPLAGGNSLLGQGGTGLLNTYGGLMFPGLISVYGVFMFRQFFQGFPYEIEDAARIDGASRGRFFWTVLIPNAQPVMGTMGLFSFLWYWNAFVWPLVIAKEDSMKTIQLGIATFSQQFGTEWALMMAASVTATLPILIVFLILQRFLVQGVATTGIK